MHDKITIEELRDKTFLMVAEQYEKNTDPDFDIAPVVFALDEANDLMIIMLQGGPPHEMLPVAIKKLDLQAYVFASAAFVRNVGSEERRECIVFMLETPTYSELWQAPITRDPLPMMGAAVKSDTFSGRMAHLLHQHTRN